ncbi:recombination regulator RecX [Enterococcus sp. RIT-PI-f]|uniref:recombination regulator RecX n=1 Tax=Enterococcus sp. RIT-PI-f TaxID=1690244 RepID=UPI0006B943B3|nr:recombination regulator RecX [Enterococcus sp. RIT-PI-f]KPG69918.1 recombinase RecX [Enterococcus sp. RIT-PI-f]
MITIIRINKGKGPFYEVETSEGEILRVSEDLLVRFRLLKGKELTKEEIKEIKKSAGFDLGLQQAMNYISYQLRSEMDVRIYLKDKEIDSHDRQLVIDRLKDLNLIDDKIYGESYVRTQIRISDKGPIVVGQQLKKKGLKETVIQEVLPLYTEELQFDVGYHTAEKALRRFQNKSHKETIQKLKLHLMQKGFQQQVIQMILDELPMEKDQEQEDSALQKEGARLLRRHQRLPLMKRKMKIKQALYQKGFSIEDIQQFLDEEVMDE